MGTCSYVLTGTEQGMKETFGSTCHGAVSVKINFNKFFFNLRLHKLNFIIILLLKVKKIIIHFFPREEHYLELNHVVI